MFTCSDWLETNKRDLHWQNKSHYKKGWISYKKNISAYVFWRYNVSWYLWYYKNIWLNKM
jgi:hypothetical protein